MGTKSEQRQQSMTDEERHRKLEALERSRRELAIVSNALADALARLPAILGRLNAAAAALDEALPKRSK